MFPLLTAVSRSDRAQVGGKAANLGELAALGLLVPRGFVVPTVIGAQFLEASPDKLEQPLPAAVEESIRKTVAYLRLERMSARSSATAEDSAVLSFAGVFESFLNVAPPDIEQAIKRCWLSAKSPRAVTYCERHGLNAEDVRMAVIVQQFISPEVSGVCFTSNPVSGNLNEIVIEAALGLGETLVSGRVTPDTYIYDVAARSIIHKVIGTQGNMYAADGKGVIDVLIDEKTGSAQKLKDGLIQSIVDSCRMIAAYYDCPQDVEFAVCNETIYFLQTRPITTMQGRT